MAVRSLTWAQRGEYLAGCQGMTSTEFADRLDPVIRGLKTSEMAGTRSETARPRRSRTKTVRIAATRS
jgi:hypothetical protein